MRRFTFVGLIVSLYILSGSLVNASEQLQIIFNDGTSQIFNLNKPTYNIRSINFQGQLTSSSEGTITVPKTNFGRRLVDLQTIKNALEMYYQDNKAYPKTDGRWDGLYSAWGQSKKDWIQGLVPNYLKELPRDPRSHTNPEEQYLYISNGVDYKLIAHKPEDVQSVINANPSLMDPHRPSWAYGFWTTGAAGW